MTGVKLHDFGCSLKAYRKEVIDNIVDKYNARIVTENRWEDGPHPLYEISYSGEKLSFYHPGVGSGIAAGLLEEAIAFGCRKFIACGATMIKSIN